VCCVCETVGEGGVQCVQDGEGRGVLCVRERRGRGVLVCVGEKGKGVLVCAREKGEGGAGVCEREGRVLENGLRKFWT
jgi:hypothetical protein